MCSDRARKQIPNGILQILVEHVQIVALPENQVFARQILLSLIKLAVAATIVQKTRHLLVTKMTRRGTTHPTSYYCSTTRYIRVLVPLPQELLGLRKFFPSSSLPTNTYREPSSGGSEQFRDSPNILELQNFFITQILHEIIFEDSRSAKSAILSYLKALNFELLEG